MPRRAAAVDAIEEKLPSSRAVETEGIAKRFPSRLRAASVSTAGEHHERTVRLEGGGRGGIEGCEFPGSAFAEP